MSLDDHVVEVREEVGDPFDGLGNSCLSVSATADGHAEAVVTDVVSAYTTHTALLIFTHELHVVLFNFHVLKVKEFLSLESVLGGVFRKHGPRRVDIEAELTTVAHTDNPVVADELSNSSVILVAKGFLDDLCTERS